MSDLHTAEDAEYEERLQQRLQLLIDRFKQGKIKIAEGLKVADSLQAVRTHPDGSINLDTVDGLVRAMALGVEQIDLREETKSIASLAEIQHGYFGYINRHFDHLYREMVKHRVTPHDIALQISQNTDMVSEISSSISEFISMISDFWLDTADIAQLHIEDMTDSMKGVYGGDLFPDANHNIGSNCGIYTDTIILPDPFLRSKAAFEKWSPEDRTYYFVKHGINILQYRELACAEISPPIVVVVPDYTLVEKGELEFIAKNGFEDTLIHCEKIFGRKFESFEELVHYSEKLDTESKFLESISDGSRVLFETNWGGTPSKQLKEALKDKTVKFFGSENPGSLLVSYSHGRLCACNELLIKSSRLGGTPIIEVPTSWNYLSWKIEYDAERRGQELNLTNLHVLKGLRGLAKQEMEWLGNVPVDALIELRKTGALDEIRQTLSGGILELVQASPDNYFRTTDQVFDNIHSAFDDHKKNVDLLKSKKWKFAGNDIGSWFVVGSLAVTAAATGTATWGIAAVLADQMLDAPKLKSIPGSIKSLAKSSKELNRSPVGILYNCKSKKG